MRTLKLPGAIGATTKHETHRRRREALNPSFSKKKIVDFEPIIREKISKLCGIVEKRAIVPDGKQGNVLNLSDLYFGFANE